MWFNLQKVELDFLHTAPKVYTAECLVALPRSEVWKAIVDPATWQEWFPGVRSVSYLGEPPHGVGTKRVSDVRGHLFEETMLAWDEPRRWVYRIDRATVPVAKAQLESTELEDHANGTTLVRWRLAVEPGILLRLTAPFFQSTVQRHLTGAMRNLEARAAALSNGVESAR